MRKFAMGAFAAPRNFVKSGCTEIVDKLTDFSWHFYRFNSECKLFDAERPAVSCGPQQNTPGTAKKPALWAVSSSALFGGGNG
jgi:hypothetical protein